MKLGFKKLSPDAVIPTYAHNDPTNAGLDFYSLHDYTLYPGARVILETGIAWDGMSLVTETEKPVLVIKSRSGNAFNHSIECTNAGIIDANYTGQIKVKLYNHGETLVMIRKGDRIAQGIVYMLPVVEPVEVFDLTETVRGANGFGSTGR